MRSSIPAMVEREIRAANGGAWPGDRETFERAARRFGFEVEYHGAPFAPGHSGIVGDTIHVPEIAEGQPLHRCYAHELAEACLQWEGRAPYLVSEPARAVRHEVARCVDLTEPRKCLTQDLHRKIARQGALLATLVERAGFDWAKVSTGEGAPRVELGYRE